MKTLNHKALIAGAAFAGLMTGNAARLYAGPVTGHQTAGHVIADDSSAKHACKGQNSCKGQGGCKTDANSCKGQNSCKGKGGCATDGSKA